jgi:hypothetical protein
MCMKLYVNMCMKLERQKDSIFFERTQGFQKTLEKKKRFVSLLTY